MVKVYTAQPTKHDVSSEPVTADSNANRSFSPLGWTVSLVEWLVFLAFAFLLCCYFWDILKELKSTSFRSLCWPFLIVCVPIAAAIVLKLLERDPSNAGSPLKLRRGITGLVVFNLATAVLATSTAQAINPAYNFKTSLLRFSALLLHQFWT